MKAIANEKLEDLKKQVLILVSVSLARYQKIETGLKAFLPFLVSESREPSDDPFSEMRELLASKTTLGPLLKLLEERSSWIDPEEGASYLRTVVDQRNELVHKFFQLPIGQLRDEEGCHDALKHLRNRLEYAKPLLDVINKLAESMIQNLEQTPEPPMH